MREQTDETQLAQDQPHPPSVVQVLWIFLRLGCTSFGGPVAHLGYFENEFVQRRGWLSAASYTELVSLAQSLPGPSSSQVGYAIGLMRAGLPGGLAAFLGFTLPSAVLMFLAAAGVTFGATSRSASVLHGLQLLAVAVVAQAVLAMQRSLAPDWPRRMLAVLAAALALVMPVAFSTTVPLVVGAAAGLLLLRQGQTTERGDMTWFRRAVPPRLSLGCGIVYALLLVACLLPGVSAYAVSRAPLALATTLYRAGAMVFGGGHVVLPLLEGSVVQHGWLTQPRFLAGYSAAQAVPGPLFSFGMYLGACWPPRSHTLLYGVFGLLSLFLPGLLVMTAAISVWTQLRGNRYFRSALTGVNAAVVGILFAALIKPLGTTSLRTPTDFVVAFSLFCLLVYAKTPPWLLVIAVAGIALAVPW